MTTTSNRELLEKADLAISNLVSDGGILQPQQTQKFLRVMIKDTKLLPMCTFVPMSGHKQEINKIRFEGRILHAASEATELASANRSKPTTSKVELDAKLYKGEVRLSNEILEDSIERAELRDTIMQMVAQKIGADVEEFALKSDTTSANADFALQDGFLKLATSHVVDVNDVVINKTMFRNMLRAMPNEYLRDMTSLRFITSVNAELDYRDSVANRQTQAGDKYLTELAQVTYSGVPIERIPLFPEDVVHNTFNTTYCLLTDPKNMHVGVWRQIRIEVDKNISAGVLVVVVTTRVAFQFAQEDAVVKAKNILMP